MAVAASTVFSRVRSLLDDDNSARYSEAADLVPAINSAIAYITAVFSAAFEQKKVQPEALSELATALILDPDVTGNTARVNLNSHTTYTPFNEKVWTIIGVEPNPSWVLDSIEDLTESVTKHATRMTLEEWNHSLEDPFSHGYASIPTDFQSACYMGPGNYLGDGELYLFIRPGSLLSAATARVAVWVLLKHDDITAGTDTIKFPPAVMSLIDQKTLEFITFQHGDDRLFKITDKEVKELIQLMN